MKRAGLAAPGGAAPVADLELVRAVVRRDRKATAAFVAAYADPVHAYVRRRLFPRLDLVDDLVQEVFVAALDSLGSYAGTSSLRTWLLGIARHKVEDHYRERLRHITVPEDEASLAEEPRIRYDEERDRAERHEQVLRVLAGMPEAHRIVLRWRYWEKRSAREMALASGKSEKAIERLLARAREEFRRRWNEG